MTRHTLRAALAALVLSSSPVLAAEAPPEPVADGPSPAAAATRLRPSVRPKMIRAGRIVSLTSFGILGLGGVTTGVGGGLTVYDFRGEWFDKWRYDEAYLRRLPAGETMMTIGAVTAITSTPLMVAGVLAEGRGLQKVTRLNLTTGWVGLGFYAAGATAASLVFLGPGVLIVGGITAGVGYLLAVAQFGINVHASRKLPAADREFYYRAKPKPMVAGAPLILEGGGGASLIVVW